MTRRGFVLGILALTPTASAVPREQVLIDGLREIKRRALEWGRSVSGEDWRHVPPEGSIYREFYDLADYALRKAGLAKG